MDEKIATSLGWDVRQDLAAFLSPVSTFHFSSLVGDHLTDF